MMNNNNNITSMVPLCICGHALNLHRFAITDCNGTHRGTGFMSKDSKCKCMVFIDRNQPVNSIAKSLEKNSEEVPKSKTELMIEELQRIMLEEKIAREQTQERRQ